jgi:hypothetical protein
MTAIFSRIRRILTARSVRNPLCIRGTKWNGNTGEAIPNWTIKLYSVFGLELATTTTDARGEYAFCDRGPGDYRGL